MPCPCTPLNYFPNSDQELVRHSFLCIPTAICIVLDYKTFHTTTWSLLVYVFVSFIKQWAPWGHRFLFNVQSHDVSAIILMKTKKMGRQYPELIEEVGKEDAAYPVAWRSLFVPFLGIILYWYYAQRCSVQWCSLQYGLQYGKAGINLYLYQMGTG